MVRYTVGWWVVVSLFVPSVAFGLGLHPEGTDDGIALKSVGYEFDVRGPWAAATMTAELATDAPSADRATFRFPLPPRAVIRGAEVYMPEEDRWEPAVVLGRNQGGVAADRLPESRRLLVQRIGLQLYRAVAWSVDSGANTRIRLRYVQPLQRTADGYALRVALDDPDAPELKRIEALEVSVDARPEDWEFGAWRIGPDGARASFEADSGDGHVQFTQPFRPGAIQSPREGDDAATSEPKERGIRLELYPDEPSRVGAVRYEPSSGGVEPRTAIRWSPDLPALEPETEQSRSIVFVVDRSGSMRGEKIEGARKALRRAMRRLGEGTQFGLVAFNDTTNAFRDSLTGLGDREAAIEWFGQFRARESTDVGAALQRASRLAATGPKSDRKLDVFLITDGLPTSGERSASTIVSKLRSAPGLGERKVRLFACALGSDLDQTFINNVTLQTGGTATFALSDSEVTAQLFALLEKARDGGLSDAVVTVSGADGSVTETFRYERLMTGRTLLLGTVGGIVGPVQLRLAGVRPDGSTLSRTTTVELPDRSHAFTAPLAGFSFARRAARRIDRNGETKARVDRAVLLARRYGIVSRYSSMLALDGPAGYDELGVERVERNEAGLALEPVASSTRDERRIGGAGTAAGEVEGCSIPGRRRTPPLGLVLLGAGVLVVWRWRA